MISRDKLSFQAVPLPDRSSLDDNERAAALHRFRETMAMRHSVRHFSDRSVNVEIIQDCVRVAGSAPSGANHQPWHFVAVKNPQAKHEIRLAAEEEERTFYEGGGGDEWIKALEPIGTGPEKEYLEIAPWLIVVFAQRYGEFDDGIRYKNYYVNESVGIATGFLLSAIHHAGLVALTHTPNPMKFLNDLLGRPASEKPVMIIPVGHPAKDATVPAAAKLKKPLDEILTIL